MSKDVYREYVSDDNWWDPWAPFDYYLTIVEAMSWGRIKRDE